MLVSDYNLLYVSAFSGPLSRKYKIQEMWKTFVYKKVTKNVFNTYDIDIQFNVFGIQTSNSFSSNRVCECSPITLELWRLSLAFVTVYH
jgi:hypothetical protein